ncbi:MAG: PilX N-terminal domain-containing pilus assembly protein [Pirellulaceae bacterium]
MKMKQKRFLQGQTGTALVFSLMLLLIMTILGISSMNNTLVQERMAANARNQTAIFEAASAGVSKAVEYTFAADNWPDCNGDASCESKDGENKKICGQSGQSLVNDGNELTVPDPTDPDTTKQIPGWSTDWGTFETVAGNFGYQQRIYCLGAGDATNVDDAALENPSQLFVLTRGSIQNNQGLEASREIEVRVGVRQPGDFPPPPISALDPISVVAAASSNALSVVGECGPAVLTSDDDSQASFIEAVGDDRIGNYTGAIPPIQSAGDSGFGEPWDSPATIKAFVDAILTTPLGTPEAPLNGGVAYLDSANAANGGPSVDFLRKDGSYDFTGGGKTAFGDRPDKDKKTGELSGGDPQITYFDGDVSMGGNVSGAGIMIVRGDLTWTGTPAFDGLIVVLGGSADFTGGGKGGANGSLILTDLDGGDDPEVDLIWGQEDKGTGGGNQSWAANCTYLQEVSGLLADDTIRDMWEINCNCSEISFGDSELMITSWRENIGWRDDAFFVN